MNRGIYPVVAGAITRERQLELLAHNLGNIHTTGFKKDEAIFGTILAQVKGPPLAGIDLFPQVATVLPDLSQGALRHTGHYLDVALEGDGFFVVDTPQGLRHFRGGQLRINDKKELATPLGDPLLGKNGPIKISSGKLTIDETGTVRVNNRIVGQLRIERLSPSAVPTKAGELYWIPPKQVEQATDVKVHQGTLEQANVNPSLDLVAMIQVTRGYEQMQKAIQTMDDLTGRIIQSAHVQG
ncbi:MAG: flagellar hook-basal body complex protein [Nitrospirae bacterium]|nr:MAG: flagellar hook-basal body complex protein [Nitrospirota bacterium]